MMDLASSQSDGDEGLGIRLMDLYDSISPSTTLFGASCEPAEMDKNDICRIDALARGVDQIMSNTAPGELKPGGKFRGDEMAPRFDCVPPDRSTQACAPCDEGHDYTGDDALQGQSVQMTGEIGRDYSQDCVLYPDETEMAPAEVVSFQRGAGEREMSPDAQRGISTKSATAEDRAMIRRGGGPTDVMTLGGLTGDAAISEKNNVAIGQSANGINTAISTDFLIAALDPPTAIAPPRRTSCGQRQLVRLDSSPSDAMSDSPRPLPMALPNGSPWCDCVLSTVTQHRREELSNAITRDPIMGDANEPRSNPAGPSRGWGRWGRCAVFLLDLRTAWR